MKRFAAMVLTVIVALALLAGGAQAAEITINTYTGSLQFTGDTSGAYAIVLVDADSGSILYQKNMDEQIEPASTTKILTLLIALEQGNMDDTVKVESSAAAANVRGSTLGLIANEEVNFEDLINGMMMKSGNDAAIAVAQHMAGSVEAFASLMNAEAEKIGMTHSNFVTPHGMHADGHYSTARDMALLTLYAMKNTKLMEIVGQESYTMPADNKHSSTWLAENTNKLLQPDLSYYYQNCTGIKTGSTSAAGDCLVASASKDGMNLACLIFKTAENDPIRWTLTKDLFEWGFNNFETVDVTQLLQNTAALKEQVENAPAGDSGVLEFNMPEAGTTYVTLSKTTVDGILDGTDTVKAEAAWDVEYPLQAPITENDPLGSITYKSESTGEEIYSGVLVAARSIGEASAGTTGSPTVSMQTPVEPPTVVSKKDSPWIWLWALIPAGLIAFLVVRLLTVNKRNRKRFKRRQPHYSYKIRK